MPDRRSFIRLASVSAAALAAPALLRAQGSTVLKFSHVVAPHTPKGRAAEKFRELAERYTEGAVRVEVYPNSQLYKDKDEMEALQLDAVQLLAPSLAKFGRLGLPQFELFDLPMLFDTRDDLRKITDGRIGARLLSLLEGRGIRGLAYWDNGFKLVSANSPLRMPEDFRGLKMRIQASRTLELQFEALGAIPQAMAFSEAYRALQAGVVDGTENVPSNMYTQRMHEVQSDATWSRHGYIGYAVIVNRAFWDGLPEDIRRQLDKAVEKSTLYCNAIAEEVNVNAVEAMKLAGTTEFHDLTDSERAAWREAFTSVYDKSEQRLGADLLGQVLDIL